MYTRVNIAVKLSPKLESLAISLSNDIAKNADAFFALDGASYLPHITLYSPEFPEKNLDKVFSTVDTLLKDMKPFITTFTKFRSNLGYIDIALESTKEWEQLHERVVSALNPLREKHLREKYKDPTELAKYTDEQRHYIQQYGYSEVFHTFRPHLTITRLKDEAVAKAIIRTLELPVKSFTVDTLAAYTMGNHGTCNAIMKEFVLADS